MRLTIHGLHCFGSSGQQRSMQGNAWVWRFNLRRHCAEQSSDSIWFDEKALHGPYWGSWAAHCQAEHWASLDYVIVANIHASKYIMNRYMYVCVYACMSICMHVCMYVNHHVCPCTCVRPFCVCVCACVCVCVFLFVFVCLPVCLALPACLPSCLPAFCLSVCM